MAAGLPVIACRSTAVPETVGDAAIYVDVSEVGQASPPVTASLLSAIDTLRNSSSRAEWIARGKARAAAFTWPACISRLATALEN
jgi:glycosyltransferase involved in cell wall biosynthesis